MNYKESFGRASKTRITAFLLCAVLCFTMAAPLARDKNTFAANEYRYYTQDADVVNTSLALNREIASEGMVLLKNDGLLPLRKQGGEKVKISVFGKHSVQITDRGYGSSDAYYGFGDLYTAFSQNATFELNPTLRAFYNDTSKSGNFRLENDRHGSLDNYRPGLPTWETPYNKYTAEVKASYADYNAAAIVVLSRYGAEGSDLPATSLKNWNALENSNKLDSARSWDSHYLQLDANEVALLQNVMNSFENVIIMVNSANPLELGFLNDPGHYLYTDNNYTADAAAAAEKMSRLKAALHIAFPGSSGALAIPDLLDGTVNPSGRLADTWAVNFKNNPVLQNFSFNGSAGGNKSGIEFVHYDEDIYMGYRYYETKYITEGGDNVAGNAWYDAEVMYPFGYGLSYTDFTWEVLKGEGETTAAGTSLEKDGTVTTKVKVTNAGTAAGKEVVQLYYNTPYYADGISKAHVVLGDFKKTGLLAPGGSETLTFTTKASDMYSYDWSDANGNGFRGYELEAGSYNIVAAKNAHEAAKLAPAMTNSYTVAGGFRYETDTETGAAVGNLFDDVSGAGKVNAGTFMGVREYATRGNNFKVSPAADKKNVVQTANKQQVTPAFDAGKPWYTDVAPTHAATAGTSETNVVKLWHLIGRDYSDPMWDKLLDQLTYKEMADLIGQGFSHTEAIPSIDKARSAEWDGPLGRRNSHDIQWVTNTLVAQTFNTELAYKQGVQFGNAGLSAGQVGGTYGIGLDIHRSPFGGRNFEYYSEDGLLSGKMAAPVIKGAATKGTYHTLKHFVVNDQETSRDNVQTWLSEQALREVYAKAFEIAVKEGGANAIMAGVNSIGNTTCAESWGLMTGLLRNEWGFQGFVITDLVTRNVDVCLRAGTDLMMVFGNNAPKYDAVSLTATQGAAIRRGAKNILYVMANSNVVNGYGGDALDYIDYGGVNTLYAVEGVDNTLKANTASSGLYGSESIKYSLTAASALPAGMSMSADGIITGAPSAAGEYEFSIAAGEKTAAKVLYPCKPKVKNYKLKVYALAGLPDTIIYEDDDLGIIPYGHAFTKSIESAVAFGNDGKLSAGIAYSLTADSELPEGLQLKDGVISGVTTAGPGTYFFTIKAAADGREPAYLDFIVTVKAFKINYTAVPIADISVGETVAINIGTATGTDNAGIRYTIKAGSKLPEGLTMSSSGVISGTAARAYTGHKFTVVAQADMAAPKEAVYTVNVRGIVFSDVDFGQLIVDKQYSFKLSAAANDGADAKVYFRLKDASGNELPSGMQLLADGTLFGTPDETGAQTFTVAAQADGYTVAEATITFNVEDIYTGETEGDIAAPITGAGNGCSGSAAPAAFAAVLLAAAVIILVTKKNNILEE